MDTGTITGAIIFFLLQADNKMKHPKNLFFIPFKTLRLFIAVFFLIIRNCMDIFVLRMLLNIRLRQYFFCCDRIRKTGLHYMS